MFFKEKKGDTKTSDLARVAALLIHAAKIDENFSKEEEVIISKALLKIGTDKDNLKNILLSAISVHYSKFPTPDLAPSYSIIFLSNIKRHFLHRFVNKRVLSVFKMK